MLDRNFKENKMPAAKLLYDRLSAQLFSKIKHLFSKKCENCSMLNGSFGKNDPCSFCKRGDLNSKNFQDAEDFFDAFEARKNCRDININCAGMFTTVFIGEGDELKGTKFINGAIYDSVCCGKSENGWVWYAFRPYKRKHYGWVKIPYSSEKLFRNNWICLE